MLHLYTPTRQYSKVILINCHYVIKGVNNRNNAFHFVPEWFYILSQGLTS